MTNSIIINHCQSLKLKGILEFFEDESGKAIKNKLTYKEFLANILKCESDFRDNRAKATLLKLAGFAKVKNIESFDFSAINVDEMHIKELLGLDFISKAENILMVGASGVGKTHLATAIGLEAVQNRIKTKFISASDLMLQLSSAKMMGKLENYFKRVICATKLLIIDEFGYLKLNEEQANLFFEVVNRRYEQGSIIITSNLPFIKWQSVLNNDEALTCAIIDRLIHHSHIISISGQSYRLRDKKRILE